jgi:LemA protein
MSRLYRLSAIAAISLPLAACGINSVPTQEEAVTAAWAEVESQYQRRADLLGNMAETVKAQVKSEQDIFVGVAEARAKANSTVVKAGEGDLENPDKVAAFDQAQTALTASYRGFLTTVEAYPNIKSDAGFDKLRDELAGTENQIGIARRDYNLAVQKYNTTIRTFPDIIGAKVVHGAKPKVPFKASTPGAEVAPKLDMSQ